MDGIDRTTLAAIYGEIEQTLATVSLPNGGNLRIGKWGERPNPPGAYLLLPDRIERMTGRTVRLVDVVVVVLVGRASNRQALIDIMDLAGAVPAALDPAAWTTMSDLTISNIEFDTVTVAGAPDAYLALLIHIDIAGA